MATYPATNTVEASELLVDVSNQMHEIVNEDAVTEVTTESGTVPSVRKALADTFLFVEPVAWDSGNNETAFNQLRTFGDETYWAPTATLTNPIAMGATPVGDNNWRLAPTGKNESIIKQWDTEAQEEVINGKIYPEIGTLQNGDIIPSGTTHLRVLVDGEPTIVVMSPVLSGSVSGISENGATIGGTPTAFHAAPSKPWVAGNVSVAGEVYRYFTPSGIPIDVYDPVGGVTIPVEITSDFIPVSGKVVADTFISDDVALGLEKAFEFANGLEVLLSPSYTIKRTISLSGDLAYASSLKRKTMINPDIVNLDSNFFDGTDDKIFESNCTNVNFDSIGTSGFVKLINQKSNFNTITLKKVKHSGKQDSLESGVIDIDPGLTGMYLNIIEPETSDCYFVFADDVAIMETNIQRPVADNIPRWFYRNTKQNPIYSSLNSGNVFVSGGLFENLNGNIVDKSNVARVFMVECVGVLDISSMKVYEGDSTTALEVVYLGGGSLSLRNSKFRGLRGEDETSYIVKDKAVQNTSATYDIVGNDFDMRFTSETQMKGCILINQATRVTHRDNKYRGAKCLPFWVYMSVDTGTPPEKIASYDNHYYDLQFPIAVLIQQSARSIFVREFVYEISNPLNIDINARVNCRVVDIYQTFNNADDIQKISVSGCKVLSAPNDSFIAHIYQNAVAVPTAINEVNVTHNEMFGGQTGCTIVRYTGTPVGSNHVLAYNIMPPGSSETIGTEPSGIRKYSNLVV